MESDDLPSTADDVAVEEVVGELVLQETSGEDEKAHVQGGLSANIAELAASSDHVVPVSDVKFAVTDSESPHSPDSPASEQLKEEKDGVQRGEDALPQKSSAVPADFPSDEQEGSHDSATSQVQSEGELDRLAKQKTKEQEIVTSSEVVARMERIEQRSRLGFTGEENRGEAEGAPEDEKQEEEETEEVSS